MTVFATGRTLVASQQQRGRLVTERRRMRSTLTSFAMARLVLGRGGMMWTATGVPTGSATMAPAGSTNGHHRFFD